MAKAQKRKVEEKKPARSSEKSSKSTTKSVPPKAMAAAKSTPAKRGSVPPASPARKESTKPAPKTVDRAERIERAADRALDRSERAPGDRASTPTTMANQKPIPDASQVRPHPDAKLNKQEIQLLYQKLVDERNRVLSGFDRHVSEALEDGDVLADEIDIAQRSTDQAWLFRFADKERKLLIEIEAALEKMRTGEYGLCEGTDEPIGYKRLELRPWTRYSVGYKELLEREKAQHTR
jgi:DnaK suppressor protein